jgi:hypothetical protein
MYSVAVEIRTEENGGYGYPNGHGEKVFRPWHDWPPSSISHHGGTCCELAREWLGHTDFSAMNGGKMLAGPRWLRQRFGWGPGTYPVHWCEVLAKKDLDCGVHAALAHEVFLRRGVESYRAQFVQEFSTVASGAWQRAWEKEGASCRWIADELIYHEGCAVVCDENTIKLWDPSAGWWIDPRTTRGYGSLRAVRVAAAGSADLRWGDHAITPGRWQELG